MGVIETSQWLNEEFAKPTEICEKLVPYFNGVSAREVYQQLAAFGMYKPSRTTWLSFESLKERNTWEQVEEFNQYYEKKWAGPDIPLFIFPIDQGGGFFRRANKKKSGVSFPDKLFLFLSPECSEKEIEALFVHEYHHVCRLNKLNKDTAEFTLLDSLIIEGLAEYAVLKHCGENYLAPWCRYYSKKQLDSFWNKYLQDSLDIRKNEKSHDVLLYGEGRVPDLLGYAAGFALVSEYFAKHRFTTKLSFSIPAAKFLSK
ncbi:DUF2268 domain-containing protein [Bacillota bacterium Lsc_1132]